MKALSPREQKSMRDCVVRLFTNRALEKISLELAFDVVRHCPSGENILTAVLERELDLIAAAARGKSFAYRGSRCATNCTYSAA